MNPDTPPPTLDPSPHLTLPPEHFYWAILDGSLLPPYPAGRKRRLGYLFETVLPLPIDDIHAIYRKLPQQKYLACGMAHTQLSGNGQPSLLNLTQAITLSPTSLPDCLEAEIDPTDLNLLQGEYEPESCSALRRRCIHRLLAAFILCSLILTIGMENRFHALNQRIDISNQQQQDIYSQVLGPNYASATLSPTLQITSELRRLERTHQSSTPSHTLVDVSPILADLFALWPRPIGKDTEVPFQTDSLSIDPEVISLRGTVSTTEEAQHIADSLSALPGWRLEPLNFSTNQNRVLTTIRLTPSTGASTP